MAYRSRRGGGVRRSSVRRSPARRVSSRRSYAAPRRRSAGRSRVSGRAQTVRVVIQGAPAQSGPAYNPAGQLVFPGDALVGPRGSKF